MSDQPTVSTPTTPAYAVAPPPPHWKDRVIGFRAATGVALAALILGGVGGAALGAVSDGGSTGPGGGFRGGPGGGPGGAVTTNPPGGAVTTNPPWLRS